MLHSIARKLFAGAVLIALITPAAVAEPLGTDPPPGAVHSILVYLGLA